MPHSVKSFKKPMKTAATLSRGLVHITIGQWHKLVDYILLKTQMGNENRWQIELLRRFGVYTFFREWEDPSWAALSLSEEGVYAETSEKFYLSSVLVTHLCL